MYPFARCFPRPARLPAGSEMLSNTYIDVAPHTRGTIGITRPDGIGFSFEISRSEGWLSLSSHHSGMMDAAANVGEVYARQSPRTGGLCPLQKPQAAFARVRYQVAKCQNPPLNGCGASFDASCI